MNASYNSMVYSRKILAVVHLARLRKHHKAHHHKTSKVAATLNAMEDSFLAEARHAT